MTLRSRRSAPRALKRAGASSSPTRPSADNGGARLTRCCATVALRRRFESRCNI